MNTKEPLLKIRFDGEAVGPGKIPVPHLLRFLSNLSKTLHRTGHVLGDENDNTRQGRPRQHIKDEVALDLVLLTEGSSAAVLGFERGQSVQQEADFGLEILERAIHGLEEIQKPSEDDGLPKGYDVGVLMAWRDIGALFGQGIERIEVTLNHRATPLAVSFTPSGYKRIQQRIKGPQTSIRAVEGRLLMADFKEHGTRCKVHPSVGDPILCLFNEEQKDEVLENILQYVRVTGEAREDALTGRVVSIRIHDIERLEDREDEMADLLPQGTPVSRGFWESPTLEELATTQNVGPLTDVQAILGTWPGDEDDEFEQAVDALRHQSMGGRNSR